MKCTDWPLIKIITGVRRAGKSYLLNEIFYTHLLESGVHENNVICFAFDSAEDIDILDEYFPEMPTTTKDKAGHDIVTLRNLGHISNQLQMILINFTYYLMRFNC